MRAGERAVAALGALLALLGAVLLRVPGVRFSAYLSFCAAAGCLLWLLLCLFARKSRIGKVCKVIFLVILSAGLLLFGALEVLILRGQEDRSALPADAVIVLGAGVNGETPSLALWTRIRAAAAYLEAHPDIPAVLSGGQGPGEDISEAEAMRRALTALGIGEERLLLEDRSTSTAENFSYSKALLEERGLDGGTIAVVTNDFHSFRAGLIARRAGLATFSVTAALPWWWLRVNYFLREPFALAKTLLLD